MVIQIPVSSSLVIEKELLPESVITIISDSLRFNNPDYESAVRFGKWHQHIPAYISLLKETNDTFILPRGYAYKLHRGLDNFGIEIIWDDRRVTVPTPSPQNAVPLRPYQEEAVTAILKSEQGIWEAPTSAGKTVSVLEAARRAGQKSLIIVDKINLAEQWKSRAKEFLNIEAGIIGDQIWQEKDFLTIALQQTLWARRNELEVEGWWNQFGFVCLDECHHASASTYQQVIQKFPARYRFGISATPKKSAIYEVAESVLGEIFHITTDEEVERANAIIRPSLKKVNTDFLFNYIPDAGGQRNNYHKLITSLVSDKDRNDLIAREVTKNSTHANLVVSKRIKHLDQINKSLLELGWPVDSVLRLTGKESRQKRLEVAERADKGHCVVLSTIADEALDIPRLDRLYLVFPTRNPDLVKQQVGRIRRTHPAKQDAVVIDFVDEQTEILRNQYIARLWKLYKPEGIINP